MSAEAAAEAGRPRPLSGGLWTLFSWLRRDEASSSESLSSAGSDRTAASFAFLAPPPSLPHPAPLSPPSPPSDTYRKRVRDRNLRRQHDRNLTLHSKYGLYRCDGGYEAFSLPFPRRGAASEDRQERERRATSECGRPRAAHVPGKRRAPPPPGTPATPATASLGRRRTRKRPAPLPPVQFKDTTKENKSPEEDKTNTLVNMNSKSDPDRRPLSTSDVPTGCRSEKYSKKDSRTKDTKPRTEKSFLKQIFENRKRNSAVESFPGKILPSISELDKQAAEIIESCKLRALEPNSDFASSGSSSSENTWFCTRCLRKYNSTVVTCPHCLPEQQKLASVYDGVTRSKASSIYTQTTSGASPNVAATTRLSGVIDIDEKQKLKEMLKEMKDSLPKRPKHEKSDEDQSKNRDEKAVVLETPTLRIGSIVRPEVFVSPATLQHTIVKPEEPPTKQITGNNLKCNSATETVTITQPVVLVAPIVKNTPPITHYSRKNSDIQNTEPSTSLVNNDNNKEIKNTTSYKVIQSEGITKGEKFMDDLNKSGNERINIHTPLKISSLFNPVYIPKNSISEIQSPRSIFFSNTDNKNPQRQVKIEAKPIVQITTNEVQLAAPSSPKTTQRGSPKAASTSPKSDVKDENDILTNDKQQSSYTVATTSAPVMIKDPHIAKESLPKKNSNDALPAVSSSSNSQSSEEKPSNPTVVSLFADQHARRRDLINQLEQSIAKGDERAAAEAAVKLAQLKLSCSVLSFSSQIVRESSKVAAPRLGEITTTNETVDSKSKTPLLHSTAPQQNDTVNKTIDPKSPQAQSSTLTALQENTSTKTNDLKSKAPSQQPTSSAPERIIRTNKVYDLKSKTPTQPSTKVNTSVQSMEIVSSKDKCKQNKEKRINLKNDATTPSVSKRETSENEPGANKHNAQNQSTLPLKSPQPSSSRLPNDNSLASIEVWVEDREATRGPVRLRVRRAAVLGELRRQAEASLGLAAGLQRWIVGHALCTDDSTPLASLAGPDLAAPFYLCLVQSETNVEASSAKVDTENVDNEKAGNVYSELVQLERRALVPNAEPFECTVCMEQCAVGGGAVLRDCAHAFCRECISELVRHCQEPDVSCPAMGCPGVLQEREIRGVVSPEEYEKWLARGLAAAESGTRNAFHCRTRDCAGWALCDPGVRRFPCPVCKNTNCVPCQAIHEGETCEQHRLKLQEAANSKTINSSQTDEGTRALLDTLITKGEALQCPECSAIITKKWGCDWVKCSACKTEICWVTRGRRWGPGGRGDTTGGCRCGVDGKRCHLSCGYCH